MIHQIQNKLKDTMDYKRFEHTLGVMYTAASLAMVHHVDIEQAMIAGLLHDCAKCIPKQEMFNLCSKYHVVLSDYEISNPALIHAKLGVVIAMEDYGVLDKDILSAIEFHTTGCPDMSVLEQIIYLADYIEPHRRTPGLEQIRELAFNDLDKAMEECSGKTISYLQSTSSVIDPRSLATYEYYKERNRNSL